MEQVEWERVMWRRGGETKSIGIPFKCDGCEAMVHEATEYVGADPLGAQLLAVWCADCRATVEAEQGR